MFALIYNFEPIIVDLFIYFAYWRELTLCISSSIVKRTHVVYTDMVADWRELTLRILSLMMKWAHLAYTDMVAYRRELSLYIYIYIYIYIYRPFNHEANSLCVYHPGCMMNRTWLQNVQNVQSIWKHTNSKVIYKFKHMNIFVFSKILNFSIFWKFRKHDFGLS